MALGFTESWLRRCAWCDRVAVGGHFQVATPAEQAHVTHTICPSCLRKQLALRERPAA